jgi:hypothetical protein
LLATAAVKCKVVDDNIDVDDWEASHQLVQSPAAENLDASQVFKVLTTAAQMDRADLLQLLRDLPAAAQLSPEQLHDIMQQAVQYSRTSAADAVYQLCTHWRLESVVAQMLPQQVCAVAYALAQLTGSKEVGEAESTTLAVFENLGQLPGMQEISADDLYRLVTAYIKSLGEADDQLTLLLTPLLTVASAQQLVPQQVRLLLNAAFSRQLYGCMALLLQLPAAQQLGADEAMSVLLVLVQRIGSYEQFTDAERVWAQMLKLPALQQCTYHEMFNRCVIEVVHLPQKL